MEQNTLSLVHAFLRAHVQPGALCIDAPAGRGRDTALLCRLAGQEGRVLAFDIQQSALDQTAALLAAEGLQAELHYLSNMEALKRADTALFGPGERSYAPLAPGIALIQDLYFGSFTAGVGVGAYLFRAFGEHEDHGLLYQKVHLRYYPPALRRVFAGVAIRAHEFGTADYIEFSIGTVL